MFAGHFVAAGRCRRHRDLLERRLDREGNSDMATLRAVTKPECSRERHAVDI